MRLCYLSDAKQEHTRRWVRYFAQNGHKVDLITWNTDHLPDYDPVNLHVIKKIFPGNGVASRIFNLPYLFHVVTRTLRAIKPDVVHAHSITSYAWMAALSGYHPYVLTPWGTDINLDMNSSWITSTLSTFSLKRATMITCDAKFVKDKLVSLGVRDDNIEIIMFGVDFGRITSEKKRNSDLLNKYNLSDSPIVISTRLLTKIRDVETFVRAVPLVKKVIQDVNFVVVGSGEERQHLEQIASANGSHDSIRFIGHVTESEMIDWLCTSDIYVSTSLTDAGLAASTAEAMACSLPVVTTDNSENSMWVHEGFGGYLYPNRNPQKLAEAIITLLNAKSSLPKFGEYNRKVILEKNNYLVEMHRVEELYETMMLRAHYANRKKP